MYSYFKKIKDKASGCLIKKAACLLAGLILVLSMYAPADAAVYKYGFSYIFKDIYIDGYHINNYQLKHPFVGCSGSTFVPLDDQVRPLLGLDYRIGGGKIQIILTTPKHYNAPADMKFIANEFADTVGHNYPDDVQVFLCDKLRTEEEFEALEKVEDLRAYYTERLKSDDPALGESSRRVIAALLEDLPAPEEKIVKLSISPSDICLCDGTVYIKASALASCEELPYSIYYDAIGGFAISTDPNVSAKDQFSDNNKSYIEGRIAYLKNVQKKLSDNDAQILEYLFRHEAVVNGVSQNLNMAIARTESTYDLSLNRVNGSRPIGLMQLMPRTVTGCGWQLSWVCTPHGNIQFGTEYIASMLARYNGNETLALSAYNQGSGTVASGNYSTAYARKVQGFEEGIVSWCASKGYSNTFYEVSEKVR